MRASLLFAFVAVVFTGLGVFCAAHGRDMNALWWIGSGNLLAWSAGVLWHGEAIWRGYDAAFERFERAALGYILRRVSLDEFQAAERTVDSYREALRR